MAGKTNCEDCNNYIYDEEYDTYFCDMELDEDEMARFLTTSNFDCPYYVSGDEYSVVKHQI